VTVYALVLWVDYEGSYLHGVYSSEVLAREALASMLGASHGIGDWHVHPVEMDAAAKEINP
jgi:hypothetical protein